MRWIYSLSVLAFCALGSAPAAQAAQKIIRGNLGPVGEGRRMFLQFNCSGCHGDAAAGGMGPNVQHAEAGDVNSAMHGDAMEGGMRSFAKYAIPADVTNIAAYLKVVGTPSAPTWHDWWNAKP